MAKTVSIALSVTGKDTANVSLNSNITNYLQLALNDFVVEDVESNSPTYPNTLAAVSIVPPMLATFSGTKIQCVARMVYNASEPAPAYVTFVADTETIEGGPCASFAFDTSLTITTTNLTYPVEVQLAFFPLD